ncbi:hypothetical protein [Brevundimonas diminuta]|uniref:hypothetical protein n=1 Tax=Brevundimonas diminuta TaxID=293 RepID=UPI003CFD7012
MCFFWGEIATALNPSLAPGRDLPDVALTAPPLHPAVTQLVLLGRYAGISIAPLLAAVLAWAAVNPQGVAAMAPSPQTPQTSS